MAAGPRNSRVDLFFLLLLIGALLGGAWLIGKRQKAPAENRDESIVRPRHIPSELLAFEEAAPINLDAKRLRGMAVGPDDRIYVLDGFKVLVYHPSGSLVRDYELDRAPHCAAFGADPNLLYLGLGRRIGVLDLTTEKVAEWKDLGEQALVGSIAVSERTVMAGDSGSRAIWVFTPQGEELARISNDGAAEGEGSAPSIHFDVAHVGDNTFWATDAGRHAVIHYSSTGMVLDRWGKQGEEIENFGGCCNPVHLAVFPDGRILIVEKKPDLVKVARPDGSLDCVVAAPTKFILKTFIADAAVDSKGRALVLDPKQGQVRIFVEKAKK